MSKPPLSRVCEKRLGGIAMGKRDDSSSTRRSIEVNITELTEMPVNEIVKKLIVCPKQPGALRISRNACSRRYCLANSKECRKTYSDFAIAFRWNLELCRNCPVGRMNTGVVSKKLSRRKN
jgi:hypothetical protein